MLFNSFIFWPFFLVVLLAYRASNHRMQNHVLLVASYIFYGYWDWRFLGLLLVSTVVDFFVAQALDKSTDARRRKMFVSVSIATNLGILGFFKYFDFFVTEFNSLLTSIGFNSYLPLIEVILPVGISFYTFQTISYTVDVYRGQTKPTNRFLDFALYVSFFPQLVAGPIERSHHLLPQVSEPRVIVRDDLKIGLYLILFGLFKKVVIADNMAPIADHVFNSPGADLTGFEVMLGVYAFAFQIYGDFSGYSSIAQGLARMLGFDLMWNFRMPYLAVSPSDFWRRWHISLSSWLRDYLYIPLGGNRGGVSSTYRNLMITMLLGGLWHGAAWTFVLWGLFHGLLLVAYRLIPKLDAESLWDVSGLQAFFRVTVFFHLVCLSWLLFRADSATQVFSLLGVITAGPWQATAFSSYAAGMIVFFSLPMFVYEFWLEYHRDQLALLSQKVLVQTAFVTYILFMLLIFPSPTNKAFIYFQF